MNSLYQYCFDSSLIDFFKELRTCITNDDIENSFHTFEYKLLKKKNQLYKAIESYEENQSIFQMYVPEIKRIGDIIQYEHTSYTPSDSPSKRCVMYKNGTYYMKFTVYYIVKEENKTKKKKKTRK